MRKNPTMHALERRSKGEKKKKKKEKFGWLFIKSEQERKDGNRARMHVHQPGKSIDTVQIVTLRNINKKVVHYRPVKLSGATV